MIRIVLAALSLAILPTFVSAPDALAQEQAREAHEVVEGNTLWDLAGYFYDDPWKWPRIYEANRDRIDDPDLIHPGQVLRIPDLETGEVREVMVVAPGQEAPPPQPEAPAEEAPEPELEYDPQELDRPAVAPADRRTVFYPDTTRTVVGRTGAGEPPLIVSEDAFYSAPWLVESGSRPEHIGTFVGFAGAEEIRAPRYSARPYDRIRLTFEGRVPAVGTTLQAIRVGRTVPGHGDVVMPTGTVTITAVEEGGATAVVEAIYDRLRVGDMIRELAPFPLEPGETAEPVTSGPEAVITGFFQDHQLQSPGDQIFLSVGARDGVEVGDEFQVVWAQEEEWSGQPEGHVQVIGVREDHSTARIVNLTNPVFRRGVRLRMTKRMP